MFNFSTFLPFLMPFFKVKMFCGLTMKLFCPDSFSGFDTSARFDTFFRWIGLAGFDNVVRVD